MEKLSIEEVPDIAGNGIKSIDKTFSLKRGEKDNIHTKQQTEGTCIIYSHELMQPL